MSSREPSVEPLSETTTLAKSGSSRTSESAKTESRAAPIRSALFQQTRMTSTVAILCRSAQGSPLLQVRPDERVDLTAQDGVNVPGFDVRPQIFYQRVGLQHVRAYLRAPFVCLAFAPQLGELRIALFAMQL